MGALAYPIVLNTIAETIMQIINSALVGRLGATELAAVGFGGIWMWTLMSLFVGAAQGVQVFSSRHFGADEERECGPWVWQAVYVLVPGVVLWCLAIGWLFPAAIHWIGTSPELETQSVHYMYARLPQGPAVVTSFAIVSFFRAIGDTRTPLIASVVSVCASAVLAYGLVFGELGLPRWEVVGAGTAMTIGSYINASIMLGFFLRRKMRSRFQTSPVRPDAHAVQRYLRTGAPIGGQWVLEASSFAVFSSVVARMGDVSMAANQAMLQLLSISFMQGWAISIASGALVGQYLGAKDVESAEQSYRSGLKIALGLAGLVAVVFVAMPDVLLRIFTDDLRVIAVARPLLALGALFQLIDSVGIVAGGALRGAGDTRWSFLMSATAAWVVRLPLLWVAVVALDFGLLGAWVAELIFIASLALAFTLRFRGGRWKSMQL